MTGYQSKKAAALDEGRVFDKLGKKVHDDDDDVQVYQRPWVGLTPEEILELFDLNNVYGNKWIEFARAVEAKLMEKNS